MKAKKTKMVKEASKKKLTLKAEIEDEPAAPAHATAELSAAQTAVARKLIAITSALVKVNSIISLAQNISAQAQTMIGEDLYLGQDIANALHVSGGLNAALFKHGASMVPNQNRLNLKVNEIVAESEAFKVHYNDIMPAGRGVVLGA